MQMSSGGKAMFYVQRDTRGQIVRLESTPFAEENEALPNDSPEAQAWFAKKLQQSDLDMIRVLEDLIEVLTSKGVISITDLPASAQAKLLSRSSARQTMGGLNKLFDEERPLI